MIEQRQLSVHIRWQGGACTDLSVQLPPKAADRFRYPSAEVDRVRELARRLTKAQIADQLNREGRRTPKGLSFTAKAIHWICWRYGIPPVQLKKTEELTVQQVAEKLGVSIGVVHYWIKHHIIQTRRLNERAAYWITLNTEDEQKLRDWVRNSSRIHSDS